MSRVLTLKAVMTICLYGFLSLSTAGERRALVIGNANYSEGGVLKNPINDARAIADLLSRLEFSVMAIQDLKRRDLTSVLHKFVQTVRPNDVVLFYFAGHGIQVAEKNYLMAVDAKIENELDIAMYSIDLSDFLYRLEERRAQIRIVLLDACRNNPYAERFRGGAGGGLSRIGSASAGTLIGFATRPGGVASDGDNSDHGLFTEQLLAHIGEPGISVEQVLKRTARGVVQKTGGWQQPWLEGMILGDFYFNANSQPVKSLTLGNPRANAVGQPRATRANQDDTTANQVRPRVNTERGDAVTDDRLIALMWQFEVDALHTETSNSQTGSNAQVPGYAGKARLERSVDLAIEAEFLRHLLAGGYRALNAEQIEGSGERNSNPAVQVAIRVVRDSRSLGGLGFQVKGLRLVDGSVAFSFYTSAVPDSLRPREVTSYKPGNDGYEKVVRIIRPTISPEDLAKELGRLVLASLKS